MTLTRHKQLFRTRCVFPATTIQRCKGLEVARVAPNALLLDRPPSKRLEGNALPLGRWNHALRRLESREGSPSSRHLIRRGLADRPESLEQEDRPAHRAGIDDNETRAALAVPARGDQPRAMAKWLLVDGFNLAYRCFFAIPELTRKDGFPTNAIHGWVKTLWRLEDQEQPHATVVFWDLGGAQDRLAIHPEYKAQREEMPEALDRQIEPMKELTRAMGMHGVEQDGVESDDLLAAQARYLAAAGDEVLIVSADKDFAQVVDDRVRMLLPPSPANPRGGWRSMDAGGVIEKFGVPPAKIAGLLALMGDNVDNIPGVAGVGPKTAAKWLTEHGDMEGVIAAAASGALKPERFREAVVSSADRLRMNLRLTTLNTGLPSLGLKRGEPDLARVAGLLESFEMANSAGEARRRYGQRELF